MDDGCHLKDWNYFPAKLFGHSSVLETWITEPRILNSNLSKVFSHEPSWSWTQSFGMDKSDQYPMIIGQGSISWKLHSTLAPYGYGQFLIGIFGLIEPQVFIKICHFLTLNFHTSKSSQNVVRTAQELSTIFKKIDPRTPAFKHIDVKCCDCYIDYGNFLQEPESVSMSLPLG